MKWGWERAFYEQARARGDAERVRLWELMEAGFARRDPRAALAFYEEGRALAERLHEPWWVLVFDHFRAVCLGRDGRFAEALEVAARATVEARKPLYHGLPTRVCLHEDLVSAYAGIDPVGYAPLLEDALAYMASVVAPRSSCFLCLQGLRTEFALALDRPDQARAEALRGVAATEENPDLSSAKSQFVYYCTQLCAVAHRRGEPEEMLRWAEAGLGAVPAARVRRGHAELLAWKALARRRRGETTAARRDLLRATALAREETPLTEGYFDAVCAFEELDGDLVGALKTRGRQLALLAGKERPFDECRCRIARCRLLARLGYPVGDELAAARGAAARLREPAPRLREIEEIAGRAGVTT